MTIYGLNPAVIRIIFKLKRQKKIDIFTKLRYNSSLKGLRE